MNEENRLIFIDQCLKKFEYPNIYAVKMPEIYGASNRKFLLSWLYSQFQGICMTEILPDKTLCEFLNWFCKSSQVKGVLEAEMEYPVQLKILYKIFKNLDSVKGVKYNAVYDDVSLQATKEFCNRDINIFKNFGPIRISDDDLILQPKVKSKDSFTDNHDEDNEVVDLSNSQLISEKLIEMENNVKSATAVISNMLRNSSSENFNIELDDNHLELFRQFNKIIHKGKKYISNVDALSLINEELNSSKYEIPRNKNDESIGMVEEVVKLIHDIDIK
ncbi:hypothetical protein WA026_020280 [Henosepilachna vigintioctopunctata]|uniref:Uncharacterized protein n=1 Tax=Henosepilachna vigintioctopunctata TaxID=420089 RepID=A0AAW1TWZ0_9CUCU